MDDVTESHRVERPDRYPLVVVKTSVLSAVLATATSALAMAILSSLPTGPRPDLTNTPSIVDMVRTAFFLSAITVFPCGLFGLLAGATGAIWLRFRKRRIRSTRRLIVEAAIAGLLLGILFPIFDSALNSPHFQRIGVLLTPLQLLLSLILGVTCALICALVFRKCFIEVPALHMRS
jgi:membrane associated rhomboid family serine protease